MKSKEGSLECLLWSLIVTGALVVGTWAVTEVAEWLCR